MSAEYGFEKNAGGAFYRDGVEGVLLRVPDALAGVEFIYPEEPEPEEGGALIGRALENPIGSLRLSELAAGKKDAVILVSDATRAVATAAVLPYVMKELAAGGIAEENVLLVVATGVHRGATEEEMKEIAGGYYGRVRIENHDPYDPEKLVTIGRTSFGNSVELNKKVCGAALRVSIGKIEAHEFAGFSGGRKSVLPGVASERCIVYNHRPEMILDPRAVSGSLDGNPVHLDMLETAKALGIDFCVNTVQNAKGAPLGVFAGDMEAAHLKGVEFLRSLFGIKLGGADIYLVTPGRPLNIDLYQSMKALIALTPAVKRGDTIIFYSRCSEGINSEDMMSPFRGAASLEGVLKDVTGNYRIQKDHALLLCKLYQKGAGVIALSPNVGAEDFSALMMTPAKNLADALETAIQRHSSGKRPRLAIIPMPQRLVLN